MSKQELHITFHNPNNEKDSKRIAEFFVSRIADKVFPEAIKSFINNTDKSIPQQTGGQARRRIRLFRA